MRDGNGRNEGGSMSDSPTPETDAAAVDGIDCYGDPLKSWEYKASKDGEVVPAEFARRIERERDEARKEWEEAWEGWNQALDERDQSRRDLVAAEELHRRRFGTLNAECEQVMRERDEARREKDCALKELDAVWNSWSKALDEAREELARVRKELVASSRGAERNAKVNQGLCSKLAEAEAERDEARTIAKMAYIRITGLGVSNHTPIQFMHDAIKRWEEAK